MVLLGQAPSPGEASLGDQDAEFPWTEKILLSQQEKKSFVTSTTQKIPFAAAAALHGEHGPHVWEWTEGTLPGHAGCAPSMPAACIPGRPGGNVPNSCSGKKGSAAGQEEMQNLQHQSEKHSGKSGSWMCQLSWQLCRAFSCLLC